MGGSFDSSKGEYRLCGVTAGIGGHSYMNHLKVPAKVEELCVILQEKQNTVETFREQYELSFNAHLNLVTIHPWVDGNGRMSRLIMNHLQFEFGLVPAKIIKEDKTPPQITLNGKNETIYKGTSYQDKGASVTDNCDNNLNIKTSGTVDTNKIGTYTITYEVTDLSGNVSSVKRTVKVIEKPAQSSKPGVIYLTFDDGPNEGTTNVILDILKEENVKATFFVTGKGPDYLIQREYNEGHTVGLHTYSHNYQSVYSSANNYYQDLYQIQNRVKNLTGYESKIIRFPGGSSNTVSKKYSSGIMTYLTKDVVNKGFKYYDWNISSGDAGETTSSSGVYNNVIKSLSKNRSNIILMHDIKPYTRDALRDIINYGKNNGYTFEKITINTPMVTHKVNN